MPGTEIGSRREELVGQVLRTHCRSASLFTPFFPALWQQGQTAESHPRCTRSCWVLLTGEGSEGRRREGGLLLVLSGPLSQHLWLPHPSPVLVWPHVSRPSCYQAAGHCPPSPGSPAPGGGRCFPQLLILPSAHLPFRPPSPAELGPRTETVGVVSACLTGRVEFARRPFTFCGLQDFLSVSLTSPLQGSAGST